MASVITVCKSQKKGVKKEVVAQGLLREEYGLIGDAHADSITHRQISLLAIESINKMRDMGYKVGSGDFAENLTTTGIDLVSLSVGTQISVGNAIILEISQIGKDCHRGCTIFRETGKCIMPKEGVFARVIHGGKVQAGDTISIQP